MKIKCPNCNKTFTLPPIFELDVENYGSTCLVYKHKKCGTNIAINFVRTVKFYNAYVTEASESFSDEQLNY